MTSSPSFHSKTDHPDQTGQHGRSLIGEDIPVFGRSRYTSILRGNGRPGKGFVQRGKITDVNKVVMRFECHRCILSQLPALSPTVKKAGIEEAGVVFVAAGFEKEDWLTRLVDAGFDPGKPTLFLWEGVMMYLDRQAVEATLRKIASGASGSVVAFDYLTTEVLESQALYWRYARAGLRAAGEPLKFSIESTPPSSERLAEFLRSCGLLLGEHRTLGKETEGKRAWGGFATAIVKEASRHIPPQTE